MYRPRKHVIVIGSGVAGLSLALRAHKNHDVTLVAKSELQECNTHYAQGGIAAAIGADDTVERHIADTLAAGAGLCDKDAVRTLCSGANKSISGLIDLGVAFDHHGDSLARGHEGAHCRARVLHAGGDMTGLHVERGLLGAVRRAGFTVMEHTFLVDLTVEAGKVTGGLFLDAQGFTVKLRADAVVLATGGAGRLYPFTTNPRVATGDGVAAAFRAGAVIRNAEMYQFHPTLLALPKAPLLVSEAVRGEGAVLRNEDGEAFMGRVHEMADLAPRDVVTRAIAEQMDYQDGRPVSLDATGLGESFLAERFPTIDAHCRSHGLEWWRRPVPVSPGAHYWMGGIATDAAGRTSLPGLFAVGEAACTGVHGANRLASNSLLEGLVFGERVADALTAGGEDEKRLAIGDAWEIEVFEDGEAVDRFEIAATMWEHAGVGRNAEGLERASKQLSTWHIEVSHDTTALEDRNLLLCGRLVVDAALQRTESRGAHFRTDHRNTTAIWQRPTDLVRK